MAALMAGSRILVVAGASRPIVLRALRSADLSGGWVVPVLAGLGALEAAGAEHGSAGEPWPIEIDVVTDAGRLRLEAELVSTGELLLVRAPGLRTAALTEQRRTDVRGRVAIEVRGTVLAAPAPASVLTGVTTTVSGGGLCVLLGDAPRAVTAGCRLYVELSMPGGEPAPAVVSVVSREPSPDGVLVRMRFTDISARDTERLVRLVFSQPQAEPGQRRRSLRPVPRPD
jgi:PilZ domain